MKTMRHNWIASAAMALTLVAALVWTSPVAYADHAGHEGWTAIGTGNRKTLDSGNYYLTGDLNSDLIIKGDVALCLNGHTLSGSGKGSVVTVCQGASLDLRDCDREGCITGGNATEGGGIYVAEGASLILEGGNISGNQANRGGGICAAEGACVTISGGEVSNNSAKSGGGIFLRCEASISGVAISGNSVEYTGAGLYAELAEDGTIALDSCVIEGNKGLGHGGGLYLKNCQVTASACQIVDNIVTDAHASGGGVYIDEYAGFTMTGETVISSNSAASQGGGVCVSGGTPVSNFAMESGEISNNSATNGGGIATTGVGSFEIAGGKIAQNSASGDGGGVYISFAFTRDTEKRIARCDIDGNTAGNYGGGVFIQGNSFIQVELNGDSIRRNSAMDGGGVYINQMDQLHLTGRLHINGNQCSGRGTNLYLHSSDTMYVAELEQGSNIGLSIEYTDRNTFTKDAADKAEMLKGCFKSNVTDFGVCIGEDGQLQFALSCRVDFDTKGGKLEKNYQVYTTGDPLGTLPEPQKDGYTFTYWDYNGKKVNPEDPVTFDKTLTANYEFNHYTVSFDPNGGSGSMATQKCRYTVPFNLARCSFVNGNLVFAGWSLAPDGEVTLADGESACSLCKQANGNVTLYAQWKQAPASTLHMAENMQLATGESRLLSVTAEPADADISDIVWSCDKEKILSVDAQGRVTGLAVGTTTVTASTPAGASASCTVKVGRRAPDREDFVFSQERSFLYDGQGQSPALLDYPEGMELSLRYLDSNGAPVEGLPSLPGSYSICIDVAKNQSFEAAQGITDSAWSFTIEQGRQQALSITGQPDSVSFGQAFALGTEGGSGNGAVTWAIAGDAALINSETGDVYVTGVGSFTVTATKQGNGGFDDVSASASFTAEKRQLTLESQPTVVTEKIYDGTSLSSVLDMGTITGFRPEDEGSVDLLASARFDSKDAGLDKTVIVSYSLGNLTEYYEAPRDAYISGGVIYPLATSIVWNYTAPLTYNCAQQQVSAYVSNVITGDSVNCTAYEGAAGVDAGDYEAYVTALDNPNYTLDEAEGNVLYWSINPRTVTVKAADLHKIYGEEDPALYTISMDEAPPVLTGELLRDYGEDAGVYTIRQGSLCLTDGPGFTARNYVLEFMEGLLTVDTAGNDIYAFRCEDVPYGGDPAPSAQAAFGQVQFSYSQDPEGWFGPWDNDNAPGLWYVKASVDGCANYSGAEAVTSFTVLREQLQSFVEPEAVYLSAGGDMASRLTAALPQEVSIINNRALLSQYKAQVWWNTDNTGYDPAVQGGQLLTIKGTAQLPDKVGNDYNQPLEVTIRVYIDPSSSIPVTEPADLSLSSANAYLGLP